jgi:hypothetical protein
MSIREAITEIVNEIGKGCLFDSHFVVQQLIKKHTDTYLRFSSKFADGKEPTLTSHQMIGIEIKKLNGTLVERQEFESWSENIHGNGGSCAAWKKL